MGKKKSWKRKRARRDNRDEPEQIAKRRKLAGDTGEYRSNRGWSIQPTSNGKFEEYYKEQNIIPEEEWDEFLKTCRTPLPTTFRITGTSQFAPMLREQMKRQFIAKLQEVDIDLCRDVSRKDRKQMVEEMERAKSQTSSPAPEPASTSGGADGADAMDVERADDAPTSSSDTSSTALSATEGDESTTDVASGAGAATADAADDGPADVGTAAEEEAKEKYSPPAVLPWYPEGNGWHFSASRALLRRDINLYAFHRFLIDQNNAGALTRQEAVSMVPPLLLKVESHHRVLDMCAAPGSKTSQLLEYLHSGTSYLPPFQTLVSKKRSPCCLVTNHEGQHFPSIIDPTSETGFFEFDRVLCDVPCSGDGTMRKNLDVWSKWKPNNGLMLHRLQIDIALRGMRVLKAGGRFVYSTCSFNPMENEAVVAQILRYFQGDVVLEDISEDLPTLRRDSGLTTWKVQDTKYRWYSNYDEVQLPEKLISKSNFPPTDEENAWMNLNRCVRLVPHHQDTGGFFVAVLRKLSHNSRKDDGSDAAPSVDGAKGDTSTESSTTEQSGAVKDDTVAEQPESATEEGDAATDDKKKPSKQKWSCDPFLFLTELRDEWGALMEKITAFYKLPKDFPWENVFARSEGKSSKLYLMSDQLRHLFRCDEETQRLRIINGGTRAFNKQRADHCVCEYRLTNEGIRSLHGFMGQRVFQCTEADLIKLVTQSDVSLDDLSCGAEIAKEGCVLLKMDLSHIEGMGEVRLLTWRGKGNSTNLQVPKEQLAAMRMLLAGPDSWYRAEREEREKASE